ncbi:MAG: sugar phosphate isomerase/epimerase [Sedimentisphaerales bacterium]|nr:sugar phosphate isomerase/epimerase [Sedimentisphaerales bacterium]
MIKPCVTISLVPEFGAGPFVLWEDLAQNARLASKLGYHAVEIFTRNPHAIDRNILSNILSENNLHLAAMGTGAGFIINKLSLTDPNVEIRRAAIEYIAEYIELAGCFGGMAIIGSIQGVIPNWLKRTKAEAWLREGLNELGPLAEQHGVPLILEPLNRYETNFINRLEQGAQIIGSLETNNIKLLADLFHMNIEESSFYETIKAVGHYIGHIHFVDSNRGPAGNGHINYAEIRQALREIKYNGYLSAEALPHPDSVTAAEKTIKTFREYFSV